MDITLIKLNESFMQVDAEASVIQELSERLTFDVPNAKYSPAFKKKHWDGKIRLFNKRNGTLYLGLSHYVEDYAKENDYSLQKDFSDETFSMDDFKNHIEKTKYHNENKDLLFLRDFQIEAIKQGIIKNRAIFLSPTGSGKSLICFSLLKFYFENTDKKILLICPTTALVEQLYTDFIEYSNNTLDIENNTCRIYSGTERFNDRRIVISTWQSVYEKDSDYFDVFETVIADECHLYKSKQTSKLFEKCLNIKFRFGFTGTLSGENIHQLQLEGLFGKAIILTTTSQMMAAKQLNKFKVKAIILKYSEKTIKENKKNIWEEEVQFLIGNKKRNKFIARLAKELKGNSLLLFSRVETHGMLIYEEIKKLVGEERVKFIYGGTDVEIREEIRKSVDENSNIILVASSQIFSTGTNIPALTNIVFTHPSKARIRILQSIGRALRKNKNKSCSYLYDIVDDLRTKSKDNYAYKHFKERLQLYSIEEFDYNINTYNLEEV